MENDIVLPTPEKEGYTYQGWQCNDEETPAKQVIISRGSVGDRNFTAVWEPITYTITLNPAGGTGAMEGWTAQED